MAKQQTTMLGKLFNRAFFRYGPLQEALTLGTAGSLFGRYLAAPLVNRIFLPKGLSEDEEETRKRRIRNVLTLIGTVPGVGTAAMHFGENRSRSPEWSSWDWLTRGPGRMLESPSTKPVSEGETKISSAKEASLSQFGSKQELPIPIASTRMLVMADPNIRIEDKAEILSYLDEAAHGKKSGFLSRGSLLRAGLGAGMGLVGASLASKVVGSVFSISDESKRRLKDMGTIAGLLYGAGVIGK